MKHIEIGSGDKPIVVFGHGWARTHRDFIPVAEAIAPFARSILLDLPGFGETPRPTENWGSAEYADHVATFIAEKTGGEILWVGHSFGGRIGLRLGVHHAKLLNGMVLVSAAGLQTQRSVVAQYKARLRQMYFKFLRNRSTNPVEIQVLEARFGSPDYVASGEMGMRDIFLSAIREDQASELPKIKLATTLIYGANDTETPPEIGARLQAGIEGAKLIVCPEFDHISVLDRGRHQIALSIKNMISEVSS